MWQILIPVMKKFKPNYKQSCLSNDDNVRTTFHLHWISRNKPTTLHLPSTSCFITIIYQIFGYGINWNLKTQGKIYWNYQPIIKEIINLYANDDYLLFMYLYINDLHYWQVKLFSWCKWLNLFHLKFFVLIFSHIYSVNFCIFFKVCNQSI